MHVINHSEILDPLERRRDALVRACEANGCQPNARFGAVVQAHRGPHPVPTACQEALRPPRP
eukprot:15462044-Alexandrium_andersonii.AAC.1